MADFHFKVDVEEVAQKLGKTADVIQNKVAEAVQTLVVSTHAFVVHKAQTELDDYKKTILPGPPGEDGQPKNVKWRKIAERIWVVEIMPEAQWIEEGRPRTSMATDHWLLKGPKVKTAADGSRYRAIPFTHAQMAGKDKPAMSTSEGAKPGLAAMAKTAIKEAGISLKKIEKHPDGSPKLGILHKIPIESPGTQKQFPGLFSKPRTAEEAQKTGFKPHEGIFHLSGLMVTQRMNKKGKVTREAITFRTVSSKHQLEGRWEYPAVTPFNALEAAYKYAEQEWEKMVQAMETEFNNQT